MLTNFKLKLHSRNRHDMVKPHASNNNSHVFNMCQKNYTMTIGENKRQIYQL